MMMSIVKPRLVFLGTPQFAVPILEKLAQSEFRPNAVFCAPDKPVGRKQILTPPPIKIVAQKYNIPVWQPANSHELVQQLKTINCQLIVSAAYGIILPKEILEAPKLGCLNIHPSLLPKYRGASPVQAAILNGDEETGVTIIKMTEKVDAGPIMANRKWQIASGKCNTPELSQILAELGADLLLETLPDWLAGEITPKLQDESQATYTKIIKKEDGLINWQKSAQEIERQIRAFVPWPSSYTIFPFYSPSESRAAGRIEGSKLSPFERPPAGWKILEADISEKNTDKRPGEIFLTDANKLAAQTGNGVLIIKKLQLAGGKPLTTEDFLRGHPDIVGQILN